MGGKQKGGNIHVVCRFRPTKKVELEKYGASGNLDNFQLDADRGSIECTAPAYDRRMYFFDRVFGLDTQQADMFEEVSEVVDQVMTGFNGCVMAYGQTSSGKTHTMEGPSLTDPVMRGVIPRTIEKLFEEIYAADEATEFTVSVSYFEIYCEKVRDLLNPSSSDLKIRESKTESYAIPDLTEVYCGDAEGVYNVIATGKTHRATSPTLMNAESSRSHSILQIRVSQKTGAGEQQGRVLKGKLFMVDLAGSEKVGKTGAKGARLEEAKNINRSLTSLGMVIQALAEKAPHVPYRDSKLTRVLVDSLGGNSKTTLIICCAAEDRHVSETITTLRFGERAGSVENNAKVNEELGVEELKAMLASARREINDLKKKIASGVLEAAPLPAPAADEVPPQAPTEVTSATAEDEAATTPPTPPKPAVPVIESEEYKALEARVVELDGLLARANYDMLSAQEEAGALGASVVELQDELATTHKDAEENRMLQAAEIKTLSLSVDELQAKVVEANLKVREAETKAASASEEASKAQDEVKSTRDSLRDVKPISIANVPENEDPDTYVTRLLMKLTQEQEVRAELEDQLDTAMQELWKHEKDKESGNSSSFFNMFSPSKRGGGSSTSREKELGKRVEQLNIRLSQQNASHEATREAQRIVLETKESVVRSLLKQNAQLTSERDILTTRAEDLTATVEQLTNLLRSVQSRRQSTAGKGSRRPSINGVGGQTVIRGGRSSFTGGSGAVPVAEGEANATDGNEVSST